VTAPPSLPARTPDRGAPARQPADRAAHLRHLEAESIHIFREVAAECRAPVMLYSAGKDSSVLLHLARKAFYPGRLPFPLLHIDTGFKPRALTAFRDATAARFGLDLIVHVNQDGVRRGINPFDHGAAYFTLVMKTEALKQALNAGGFDAAFGGARRDEDPARAKERVVSVRSARHEWDPKRQRPEFWNLCNARTRPGQSLRVFPLSNWTESDVWDYILRENLAVVALYLAAERPVVERDGTLIVVDDDRMRLRPGEAAAPRLVRFRSLGCWPLTGAIPSTARTLPEVVAEVEVLRSSERGGRLIDRDAADSMEKKKREGYF
jgi:sulfate adenylyltransferase subunit 2